MKKHLLTALLILIFHFSFSQNWSFINLSDKFNYKLDQDNIITATIWSDSVEVNGNDSVYYLNRIMCDTCVTIIGGPNPCDTCYAAKNRPQFFQRQATVSANGIVNFRDTGNIVLNTLASLNDSWLFDSTWNISATVIAVGVDSVFGNIDSVKTILLSSGDTIILSQSFGALQFPRGYGQNSYYRLVGIEGRNLGEQVLKFADFFNFNVGDMFEYHKTGSRGADCFIDEKRKEEITSKQTYPDSVVYGIHRIISHHEWDVSWAAGCESFSFYGIYNGSLLFKDSADHFTNKFNSQTFNLSYHIADALPCVLNDSALDKVRTFRDSNQVLSKSFGVILNYIPWGDDYYYSYTSFNNSDTLYIDPSLTGGDFFGYSASYKYGLGMTDYVLSPCFEGIDIEHMIAYRKGNDTVGVFTPDSMFTLGINDYKLHHQIKIFPNPSSTKLSVQFPQHSNTEVLLSTIEGRILLRENTADQKIDLDIRQVQSGFYFITIKTSDGIFSKKVIIQH